MQQQEQVPPVQLLELKRRGTFEANEKASVVSVARTAEAAGPTLMQRTS